MIFITLPFTPKGEDWNGYFLMDVKSDKFILLWHQQENP
jgi:hypothetical protein